MKTYAETKREKPTKSILDFTPEELAVIDNYQTRNRGFRDEDDDRFKKRKRGLITSR